MEAELLDKLRRAVLEYDAKGAAHWAEAAMRESIDPLKAMEALTDAIRHVGDGFGRGELWLPELVGAAAAMEKAMPVLQEAVRAAGMRRRTLGIVVIGTVYGDIHTIGKSMVATMLTAAGFEVVDLGTNVPAERFVDETRARQPDILAMSALLTSTAPQAKQVIDILGAQRLREKTRVIVGGGAITESFAEGIGADGYAPTAPGAVHLVKGLLQRK